MEKFGYREIYTLVIEQLGQNPRTESYGEIASEVVAAGYSRNLLRRNPPNMGMVIGGRHTSPDEERARELVRQAMWDLLVKGLIVFGLDTNNPNWPWFRLTDIGREFVKVRAPQPYDPDGFIAHFRRVTITPDPTVEAYVIEAVHTFNRGCNRAAAVMLGCASEKLILLLIDAFDGAISDTGKKASFQRALGRKRHISHQYTILKEHLDLMTDGKKLPYEHAETVGSELPSGYEILRRCRNAGGHPDVPGDVDPDTVFLNLRFFTEYARRVAALIQHFKTNAADW
jgi:hypothetical protein